MQSHRSDIVAGPTNLMQAVLTNYQCGHCNSDSSIKYNAAGTAHLLIHHDDGCPVLTGALSALPDTLRAATKTT